MRILLGFFLLLTLVLCSCKPKKKTAPEAYFLKSDAVSVTTTLSTQGTNSNKITDLWLYVNGQFQGAYPVGATLPIASTGQTEIVLYPGIKNNGISATRQPYEFYAPLKIDTIVEPNVIMNRKLNFQYKSDAIFHFKEDFEGFGTTSGITMSKTINSDTGFVILNNDPDVFEGKKCMYFILGGDARKAEFQSNALYSLPASGAPVYLELNYKCASAFEVGVYNGSTFRNVISVNASASWNKIYAQLSFGVSSQPVFSKYGIFIRAYNSKPGDYPSFFIDNLKLISY